MTVYWFVCLLTLMSKWLVNTKHKFHHFLVMAVDSTLGTLWERSTLGFLLCTGWQSDLASWLPWLSWVFGGATWGSSTIWIWTWIEITGWHAFTKTLLLLICVVLVSWPLHSALVNTRRAPFTLPLVQLFVDDHSASVHRCHIHLMVWKCQAIGLGMIAFSFWFGFPTQWIRGSSRVTITWVKSHILTPIIGCGKCTQVCCIVQQIILVLTSTIVASLTGDLPLEHAKEAPVWFLLLIECLLKVLFRFTFAHAVAFPFAWTPWALLSSKVKHFGALIHGQFLALITPGIGGSSLGLVVRVLLLDEY